MIRVEVGDLVSLDVEAVVCSVTSELEPATPLSRDLCLAAGTSVLDQVRAMGDFPIGGAVLTAGGRSNASFIIHVVIQSAEEPVTGFGVGRALLNGLRRAASMGVETVAVPPLGMGAGNLEAEASADAMVKAFAQHGAVEGSPGNIRIIVSTEYERSAFEGRLRLDGLLSE